MKVTNKWYRQHSPDTQIWEQTDTKNRKRYYVVSTWKDKGQKLLTRKSYLDACLADGVFVKKEDLKK